jgi:hypothetical protein
MTVSRYAKSVWKRGQTGQAIIILAIGFVALLCFVGIVTDVSLLFVRYSTLRRAVDAAAIAASSQMRRATVTQADMVAAGNDPNKAQNLAFARSVTNVNLAARQFVEFYGLNPSEVVVDSCDTVAAGTPEYTTLQCAAGQQPRKLVLVTAQVLSPTVFLRLVGWNDVTLQATAISETAVLDVVMIFDASESMASQTNYDSFADIPIRDANGRVTSVENRAMRWLPPLMGASPNLYPDGSNPYTSIVDRLANLNLSNSTLRSVSNYAAGWQYTLRQTQAAIDANPNAYPVSAFTYENSQWRRVTNWQTQTTRFPQNRACGVKFFPFAQAADLVPNGNAADGFLTDNVRQEYEAMITAELGTPPGGTRWYPDRYDGFQPTYNYFGCCNDPNGDGNFSDLVCKPFRQMRDAALEFLNRLDFQRGDRVGFVTFDRTAYTVDLNGTALPTPMVESQANAVQSLLGIVGVRAEPNFYADTRGQNTNTRDGFWDSFVIGNEPFDSTNSASTVVQFAQFPSLMETQWSRQTSQWISGSGFDRRELGTLNHYPVKDQCYFQNAMLPFPLSLFSSPPNSADYTRAGATAANPLGSIGYSLQGVPLDGTVAGIQYQTSRFPTPLAAWNGAATIMTPDLNEASWDTYMRSSQAFWSDSYVRQLDKPTYSYEFRSGCASSNVGAALRVANSTLLNPQTVRDENSGAVWVMILLGDGAAGASDPSQRNGNFVLRQSDPYYGGVSNGGPGIAITNFNDARAEYGAYGVCPYGSVTGNATYNRERTGELTRGFEVKSPRCMDELWNTRQTCTQAVPVGGRVDDATLDLFRTDNCQLGLYDVDDFARDWADFIGLTEVPRISPFALLEDAQNRSAFRLPTVFTIGFGLDFASNNTGNLCTSNLDDCLGEELLRYIADVGDNNRIDSDYYEDLNEGDLRGGIQFHPNSLYVNGVTALGNIDDLIVPGSNAVVYADRGPCETSIGVYPTADDFFRNATNNNPSNLSVLFDQQYRTAHGESCGNYFNAPDATELATVFDQIAQRMFTRLTR